MGAIPTKTELIDLAFRTFWTFAAALIGNIAAVGTNNLTMAAMQAMTIAAAYSAVVTVIKTYVSNKMGTGTATEKEVSPFMQPVASNNATPAGTTQAIVPAGIVPPREPVITQDPPPVVPKP